MSPGSRECSPAIARHRFAERLRRKRVADHHLRQEAIDEKDRQTAGTAIRIAAVRDRCRLGPRGVGTKTMMLDRRDYTRVGSADSPVFEV